MDDRKPKNIIPPALIKKNLNSPHKLEGDGVDGADSSSLFRDRITSQSNAAAALAEQQREAGPLEIPLNSISWSPQEDMLAARYPKFRRVLDEVRPALAAAYAEMARFTKGDMENFEDD